MDSGRAERGPLDHPVHQVHGFRGHADGIDPVSPSLLQMAGTSTKKDFDIGYQHRCVADVNPDNLYAGQRKTLPKPVALEPHDV